MRVTFYLRRNSGAETSMWGRSGVRVWTCWIWDAVRFPSTDFVKTVSYMSYRYVVYKMKKYSTHIHWFSSWWIRSYVIHFFQWMFINLLCLRTFIVLNILLQPIFYYLHGITIYGCTTKIQPSTWFCKVIYYIFWYLFKNLDTNNFFIIFWVIPWLFF